MWKESANHYKKKIKEITEDKENLLFVIWFLGMAVYYGFRLFALTPWYDELYTYYYFISKGPVYAAIHWPLPNNHVGYSVLSGFLNLLGSGYIGLRGISYIGALLNLFLLYRIGRRCLYKGWAFLSVALYSAMNLVNQLAVQGRGYTFAVTCYLTAVYMLLLIGEKPVQKKNYIIFSLSLTLGLYILPSSVYWVLPVCFTGGLFLLIYKKTKPLLGLIISSVIAALNTVILYGIIWLAIGSNLLTKQEGSAYFGQGHISIILKAPLKAISAGVEYMLATPYIQSVEREGYLSKLADWLQSLFDYLYPQGGTPLMVVSLLGLVILAVQGIRAYKEGKTEPVFLALYTIGAMVCMPLFLLIQCKLPYFRVFSYIGIPVAVLICCVVHGLVGFISKSRYIHSAVTVVITLFVIVLLLSKDYNSEYGMSEYYVKDALEQAEITEDKVLCVTDCYQQYLLKFCLDIECESTQIEGADIVLLAKEMTEPEEEFRWEFYHTYETIPWDYVNENMQLIYENEGYLLYETVRK